MRRFPSYCQCRWRWSGRCWWSRPLSAKNAILIVDVARDRRLNENKSIIEAAVEAAGARFRPIIMTSFAFILGVAPLFVASARKSIGITVFSGMIASTCLAVLFAPSIFVVVQRFEEWRSARKHPRIQPAE
jgi:HAE1 family hydrophobic/amphiphilic exporter-1